MTKDKLLNLFKINQWLPDKLGNLEEGYPKFFYIMIFVFLISAIFIGFHSAKNKIVKDCERTGMSSVETHQSYYDLTCKER